MELSMDQHQAVAKMLATAYKRQLARQVDDS